MDPMVIFLTLTLIAIAESRYPASVELNSLWIEYDQNLHLVDPQYNIKVSDKKLFNAFTIKPKVCDWLSHCLDVIQEIEIISETSRNFSFKFSPFKYSRYIKLRFYIEYFQPTHETNDLEIDFELKLLHFGDPCFIPIECKDQKQRCESNDKEDTPNKPECDCPQTRNGVNCEHFDYCVYKSANKKVCFNIKDYFV